MYKKIYAYSDSVKKDNEDILDIINNLFNEKVDNSFYKLPDKSGKGHFSTINPNKSMKITICDMNFNNNMSFYEATKTNCFLLYFCISECFQWQNAYTNDKFCLERDKFFIHKNYDFTTRNDLEANKRYIGLGIGLDEKKFGNLINDYFSNSVISNFSHEKFSKITISTRIRLILRDILTCTYSDVLKSIYIEGKVLELLSVLANDLGNNGLNKAEKSISRGDLESLNAIKDIIDKNYVNPLTINELSRIGFISQTKLKSSFKKVFEKTIYEYVIDKRMESARELLDSSKVKVKEAASMVGYSNIGYFSKSFKEKYGFSPSEYLKLEER